MLYRDWVTESCSSRARRLRSAKAAACSAWPRRRAFSMASAAWSATLVASWISSCENSWGLR